MRRIELYDSILATVESMRDHASAKGDGVGADKARKLYLKMQKLYRHDESPMYKENV